MKRHTLINYEALYKPIQKLWKTFTEYDISWQNVNSFEIVSENKSNEILFSELILFFMETYSNFRDQSVL